MKKLIYIENEIKEHPRTIAIVKKFKDSKVIYINNYSEVFNKKNQSFDLQKSQQEEMGNKRERTTLMNRAHESTQRAQ